MGDVWSQVCGASCRRDPIFGKGVQRSTFQWRQEVFFEGKGGGIQWMRGLLRISAGKSAQAIQWTAGLWKLKSCCPQPLPDNQLLSSMRNKMITDRHKLPWNELRDYRYRFVADFNCLGFLINCGLPIPTLYFQKIFSHNFFGITIADFHFSELVTMRIAVAGTDFNFCN